MRIGIDATILNRQVTGIGMYTNRLAEALANIEGNKVFLFANKIDLKGVKAHPNITIVVKRAPSVHLFIQLWLPYLCKKYKIDVLHGPNFYLPIFHKTPQICTVHDLSAKNKPEHHSFKHRISQLMVKPSVKAATRIICDSYATAHDLEKMMPKQRPKINVVHLGVDHRFYPRNNEEILQIREKYALPEKYILFVGTLEPRKNVLGLIEAYNRSKLDIPLVIGGGVGWKFSPVYDRIFELGIQNSVHFPGYIEVDDLPSVYSGAEFFCYPSLYEGFGLPPLEAQASGTPVLTSDISSLPEVVGDSAVKVDPNSWEDISNAMINLHNNEGLRQSHLELGFENVKKFTWEKTALETMEVYKTVCEKKS